MSELINLATRSYYNRSRVRRSLSLFCILLLGSSLWAFTLLSGYRAEGQRLAGEVSQLKKRLADHPSGVSEQEFQKHTTQVAELNAALARRRVTGRVLLDMLEKVTPTDISLTSIQPDQKKGVVKIEGRTRSLALLSTLMERLDNEPGVHHPTLLTTESPADQAQAVLPTGIRFVTTFGWNTP